MTPPDHDHAPEVTDVDVEEAARRMRAGALVVDVREDDEWEAGHLEGSLHQRMDGLDPAALPQDRDLVAVCRSGRRSGDAARQLRAAGHDVVNLDGGLKAWTRAGGELVTDSGAAGELR